MKPSSIQSQHSLIASLISKHSRIFQVYHLCVEGARCCTGVAILIDWLPLKNTDVKERKYLFFFKCGEGQKEVGRNPDKVNSQSKALKWEFV